MNQSQAVRKIDRRGALLVFPMGNRKEPLSLWSEFFPRTPMRWEWDDGADDRVARLWSLMKRMSSSRKVIYSKWYQGRATFFSRELFASMLCVLKRPGDLTKGLSRISRALLDALESDSPLSTKELKALTDLMGRDNESAYARGLKELFSRMLIVAYGEVDDGAFPSLAIGSTRLLYEELWVEAGRMDLDLAQGRVDAHIPRGTKFREFFDKVLARLSEP